MFAPWNLCVWECNILEIKIKDSNKEKIEKEKRSHDLTDNMREIKANYSTISLVVMHYFIFFF